MKLMWKFNIVLLALFAVGLTKFFPASAAGTIPATHSQSTTPLLPKPNEILGIGPL